MDHEDDRRRTESRTPDASRDIHDIRSLTATGSIPMPFHHSAARTTKRD